MLPWPPLFRAARAMASAVLSYGAALALALPQPVWAPVSALVVAQDRLPDTLRSFRGRLIGTALGVALERAGHVVVVELLGRLGIGVEDRAGVRGDEVGQLRDVAVVGMLVGDQNRVEIVDAVEPVGEVSRVEQHLGPVDLDEQTGMAEVGDLHDSTVPVHTTTGKNPHPNAASRIRTKP